MWRNEEAGLLEDRGRKVFLEDKKKKNKCKDTKARTSRLYCSENSKKSNEDETQGPMIRAERQEEAGGKWEQRTEGLILTMHRGRTAQGLGSQTGKQDCPGSNPRSTPYLSDDNRQVT